MRIELAPAPHILAPLLLLFDLQPLLLIRASYTAKLYSNDYMAMHDSRILCAVIDKLARRVQIAKQPKQQASNL